MCQPSTSPLTHSSSTHCVPLSLSLRYLFPVGPPPSSQKLQLALRIISEFKEVFEEYRVRAVAEVGPQAWSPAPKSLFLRLVRARALLGGG